LNRKAGVNADGPWMVSNDLASIDISAVAAAPTTSGVSSVAVPRLTLDLQVDSGSVAFFGTWTCAKECLAVGHTTWTVSSA
jgi:hypothetical protein